MTSRNQSFLEPPAAQLRLTGFPENRPLAGTLAFKAHKATRQPGYFAPRPPSAGRFSVLAPMGTCYLAATLGVAVGELISPVYIDAGYVPASEVEGVVVTAVMLPGSLCFANVSDPAVKPWGVTTELTSTDDYDIPWQWAARFASEGYDGVFYTARFSPGGPNAWAWFGQAGGFDLHARSTESAREACIASGLRVLDPPTSLTAWRTVSPPKH